MMALTSEGPARTDAEAWASCIAGAEYQEVYLARLRKAGFEDVETTEERVRFDGEGCAHERGQRQGGGSQTLVNCGADCLA